MTVVLLEPHHDDAVLFACYTLLREKPRWITVLGDARVQEPVVQGIRRSLEGRRAAESLGLYDWGEWNFSDVKPDWGGVAQAMRDLDFSRRTLVYAPLPEDGGHEQHDLIGHLAREVFGDRCRFYATYRRGSGRTQTATEVIPENGWRAKKMRALSCYSSQIDLDNTRPWFTHEWDREWVA